MAYTKLTNSEQLSLVKKIIKYDKDEDKLLLIESVIDIIRKTASKYSQGDSYLFDDLVQIAKESMLKTAIKYDFIKDTSFNTYMSTVIWNDIYRYSKLNSRITKTTYEHWKDAYEYRNKKHSLEDKLGRTTTYEEIIEKYGYTYKEIKFHETLLNGEISIHENVGEDYDPLENFIGDDTTDFEDTIKALDFKDAVKSIINNSNLKEKQKEILKLRYGLYQNLPRTYKEIAGHYGVTHQSIAATENRALCKIRRNKLISMYANLMDNQEMALEYISNNSKFKTKS